jgi:hypothetical protein
VSFLFWNLNKRPVQEVVATLTLEHGVDVLMLAESEIAPGEMLRTLNRPKGTRYCFPFSEAEKISIFTRFPARSLVAVFDDPARRLTVRRLIVGERTDILLAVVHFHSCEPTTHRGP